MINIRYFLFVTILTGLTFMFSGCSATGDMVSDSQIPGKTKIVHSVEINAAKTKVWRVLAEFDNLDWTQSVISTHYINETRGAVGAARHCDLKDDGYIVERITEWQEGRGFTYAIDDASDPITTDSYVTWSLNGNEEKAKVTFEVHYELKYGILGDLMNSMMAKKKFSKTIVEFMDELKIHVENQG